MHHELMVQPCRAGPCNAGVRSDQSSPSKAAVLLHTTMLRRDWLRRRKPYSSDLRLYKLPPVHDTNVLHQSPAKNVLFRKKCSQ